MEGPDEDDDYNDRYSDSNGSSSDHSVENNNINNTPQLSVSSRLNPKLTKRNPASSMDKTFGEDEDEDVDIQNDNENNSVEMEYSVDSMTNSSVVPSKKVNPRLHLMHNGQWIPKKFSVGRPVRHTGVWDCCGDTEHLSMYCESEAARLRYKDLLKKEEAATEEEKDRTTRTKKFLLEHINNAKGYTDEDIAHFQEESRFSLEEKAIMEACSLNNSFNAPMLVSWLTKHFNEEVVMIKGLEFLSKHLETVEGCVLMEKHNVIEVLLKIQAFFKSNPPMQLLVLPAIRRLLDCNYTRGKIIKDTKVLKSVFSIAHLYMNSKSHIDLAARCIMQCSRSEVNRSEIIKLNVINYLLTFSGRFAKNSSILRSILRLLLWVSNTQERLEIVCQLKGVHVALRCMKKHTSNRDVMGPAIAFLARAAAAYPPAMATILYKNGMPDIVNAMKLVYDDEVIQIEAIKLIQLLTKTSEGWKQLSELKGGWQLVCQGTTLGDALVHEQPGGLHNPGWAIGEMPFLPLLERRKLDAAKYAKSSIDPEPKTSWTASSLREFMGLSMAGLTLAINREYHDTYFDLLSTLDLLPKESTSTEEAEEREAWFHRLKVFESENMVKIDDMVNTVLAMKRREEATKKSTKYDSVAGPSEAVKELYVMGSQITSQTLTQTDIDIADRLAGIMN